MGDERGTGLGKRKPVTNGRPFRLDELDDLQDWELERRVFDLQAAGLNAAAKSVRGILKRRARYRQEPADG